MHAYIIYIILYIYIYIFDVYKQCCINKFVLKFFREKRLREKLKQIFLVLFVLLNKLSTLFNCLEEDFISF